MKQLDEAIPPSPVARDNKDTVYTYPYPPLIQPYYAYHSSTDEAWDKTQCPDSVTTEQQAE